MESNSTYETLWDVSNQFYCVIKTDDSCAPHFHQSVEILYNLTGEKHVRINGKDFYLQPRQFAVSNSYDVHQYCMNDPESRQVVLVIPFQCAAKYIKILQNKKLESNIVSDPSEKILFFIRELAEICNPIKQQGLVDCILGEILELIPVVDAPHSAEKVNLMRDVFDYIEEHYRENITLESISQHFGYNKFYFSRFFNASFYLNLNDYLGMIRTGKTIEALENGCPNVLSAALENGFGSVKTFYKFYRKLYPNIPLRRNRPKEASNYFFI